MPDVANFINALHNSLNILDQRKRTAVAEAQSEKESEQAQQRIDAEKERIKNEHDLAQAQLALTSKAASLNQLVQQQKVAQGVAETGIVPPGVTQSGPAVSPGVGSWNPQTGMNDTQTLAFPSGDTTTVPTPTAYATQQAGVQRIANAPAIEAKNAEQAAAQEAETTRQLKLAAAAHINRLSELAKENDFKAQQQLSAQAAAALKGSENAIELRKAMINATGGLSEMSNLKGGVNMVTGPDGAPTIQSQGPADFVSNNIRSLRDGTLTSDELKKRFPKQASTIMGLASEQGVGALTKEQGDKLSALETTAGIVPVLHEMNSLVNQFPNEVFNPTSDAHKQFEADKAKVAGVLPAVSTALSSVKRFNNFELEGYKDYLIPGRGVKAGPIDLSKGGANASKYNDFVTKDIQDAFNTITANLPEGQRAIIKQRIGLNNLPYLGAALQAPGSNPGTPSNATPATSKIIVKRKSDGQTGTIDPKDYDPKKYDRIQ